MSNLFESKTPVGEAIMERMVSEFVGDVRYLGDSALSTIVEELYELEGKDMEEVGLIEHVNNSEYDYVGGESQVGEVFKVTNEHGTFYFEVSGYNVSHEGWYYEVFAEVQPRTRTVTEFV